MKITYNEFLVLTTIEKEKEKLSQRKLSELTKLSLGTVNKIVSDLLKMTILLMII